MSLTQINKTNEKKLNLETPKKERKLEDMKCLDKHNLNFFSNLFNNPKSKKETEKKFCLNCNGLFIYNSNKKIYKTISNLEEKITPNYFNPYLIYIAAKETYKNENFIYKNSFLKYRKEMINFVLKLKSKYKASSDSFFLAINLIDIVCSKIVKFDIDIELISIGCKYLENDCYIGSFKELISSFKKIYYSSSDMQKAEVYCMGILQFNLSRTTAKQFYDSMCSVGFIFEEEINKINCTKEFYKEGIDILNEIIFHQDYLKFSAFDIAFSIVKYLREINFLEKSEGKIYLLENIFNTSEESYKEAWNFLCKIKNYSSWNLNLLKKEIKEKKSKRNSTELLRKVENNNFSSNKNEIKLDCTTFSSSKKPNFESEIDDPNLIMFKGSVKKDKIVNLIRSASLKKKNPFDEHLSNYTKSKIKVFDYNDNDNDNNDDKNNLPKVNSNINLKKDNYISNGIKNQFISNTSKKLIDFNNFYGTKNNFVTKSDIFNKESSYGINFLSQNQPDTFRKKAVTIKQNNNFNFAESLKQKIAAPIRRSSKLISEDQSNLIFSKGKMNNLAAKRSTVDNLVTVKGIDFKSHASTMILNNNAKNK